MISPEEFQQVHEQLVRAKQDIYEQKDRTGRAESELEKFKKGYVASERELRKLRAVVAKSKNKQDVEKLIEQNHQLRLAAKQSKDDFDEKLAALGRVNQGLMEQRNDTQTQLSKANEVVAALEEKLGALEEIKKFGDRSSQDLLEDGSVGDREQNGSIGSDEPSADQQKRFVSEAMSLLSKRLGSSDVVTEILVKNRDAPELRVLFGASGEASDSESVSSGVFDENSFDSTMYCVSPHRISVLFRFFLRAMETDFTPADFKSIPVVDSTSELKRKLRAAESSRATMSHELDALLSTTVRLKASEKQWASEKKADQERLAMVSAKKQSLEAEKDDLATEVATLQGEVVRLSTEFENVKCLHAAAMEEKSALNSDLKSCRELIVELKEKESNLVDEAKQLNERIEPLRRSERELDGVRRQVEVLRDELRNVRGKFEGQESAISGLEADLRRSRSQVMSLTMQVSELEEQLAAEKVLTSKKVIVESDLASERVRTQEMSNELEDMRRSLEKSTRDLAIFAKTHERVAALQEEKDAYEEEILRQSTEMDRRETLSKECQNDLADATERLSVAQKTIEDLKGEVERLSDDRKELARIKPLFQQAVQKDRESGESFAALELSKESLVKELEDTRALAAAGALEVAELQDSSAAELRRITDLRHAAERESDRLMDELRSVEKNLEETKASLGEAQLKAEDALIVCSVNEKKHSQLVKELKQQLRLQMNPSRRVGGGPGIPPQVGPVGREGSASGPSGSSAAGGGPPPYESHRSQPSVSTSADGEDNQLYNEGEMRRLVDRLVALKEQNWKMEEQLREREELLRRRNQSIDLLKEEVLQRTRQIEQMNFTVRGPPEKPKTKFLVTMKAQQAHRIEQQKKSQMDIVLKEYVDQNTELRAYRKWQDEENSKLRETVKGLEKANEELSTKVETLKHGGSEENLPVPLVRDETERGDSSSPQENEKDDSDEQHAVVPTWGLHR